MKRVLLLFLIIGSACKGPAEQPEDTSIAQDHAEQKTQVESALPFDVYDYDGIEPLINLKDDKIHVVNFWATWCAPCIKELPYFQKLEEEYKDQNLDLLLVSLDFPRQYETKLVPFLKQRQITTPVVAIDDVNMNRWIPLVDSTWSGAIPATIIYRGTQRKFYEQSFSYEELETEIKQFLN